MACFLAPMTEAVVVSAIEIGLKRKEKKQGIVKVNDDLHTEQIKKPFSQKLGWLNKMLWGGSFLLAIEHVWHGEIVAYPPFLTAMSNPADAAVMGMEIATVGVTMAVTITAVWGVMLAMSKYFEKKATKESLAKAEA